MIRRVGIRDHLTRAQKGALRSRHYRQVEAEARVQRIAASIPRDLFRLSPALLIRDVMQVFRVSRTTARSAVLVAGSALGRPHE